MIKLKTSEEIKILREGGFKLAAILNELIGLVCPGATTGELEARACELIKKAGGRPSFKNHRMHNGDVFPTAICASINNEVVHAPARPERKLREGDIIGIDVGLVYPFGLGKKEYFTDMAATVPVGKVDKNAKKLIETARQSLKLAIGQVKPGNCLNDIGAAIQNFVEQNGFSVVRELVGHGVGHDVHEEPKVPNYKIKDSSSENIKLKPGLVIAIEPMVNAGGWKTKILDDGFTVVTADGSLSAHFEHTVAVTEEGYIVLTEL